MARINIEDEFWEEVIALAAAIGDQDRAVGQAVRFFKLAQGKHKKGKLITADEFERGGFSEHLVGTFAERVDGGIRAIGAQKHFGWLAKKAEAGKAGGSKPKQKKAKPSKPKQTEASSSSSLSPSISISPSSLIALSAKPPTPVGVYVDAYQAKYGFRPEVGPREGKILKTFSENHPDRWQDLIEGYLQMPDSWAVQRSHPVEVLVAKVNEIGRFLATGKVVTRKVVQAAEEMVDKAQGTDRKPRKSIEELEREREEMLADANAPKAIGGAQ